MAHVDLALIDTNVLVYAVDEESPYHAACARLDDEGGRGMIPLCVAPQVLFEFYATVTNPRKVAHPQEPSVARMAMETYARRFRLLEPPGDLAVRVKDILRTVPVTGLAIFDIVLAATMQAHGVQRVYSYDHTVLSRVAGVTVLTP